MIGLCGFGTIENERGFVVLLKVYWPLFLQRWQSYFREYLAVARVTAQAAD